MTVSLQEIQLNTDNSTPLYRQLYQQIRELVEKGKWPAETALPPERDLATNLGISRITVRKAMAALANDRLIYKRQGAGSFVRGMIHGSYGVLSNFSDDMRSKGFTPSSTTLEANTIMASPEIALTLGLTPGSTVSKLVRLRFGDDEPFAYEETIVPQQLLDDPQALDGSLYNYLRENGHQPVRGLQRIRAIAVNDTIAQHLKIEPGLPIFFITRTAFNSQGTPVEFTKSYYRADVYDFVAELKGIN